MKNSLTSFFEDEGVFELQNASGVACYQCVFDDSYYEDLLFVQHGIEYDSSLHSAVRKRKSEFLAGRYAAQQIMKKLGVEKVNIRIGEHRSPVWPDPFIGSITHTARQAICAVARHIDYQYIGIDLENWITLDVGKAIKDSIIQPSEEKILSALPLLFEQALTLAFSAKESLFKALYPFVGDYFAFDAAEIYQVEMHSDTFHLKLTRNLTTSLTKGQVFTGHFLMSQDTVFTYIFMAKE